MRGSPVNSRSVAIVVFDGVEVLDFAGLFEVISVPEQRCRARPVRPSSRTPSA